PPPEIAGHLIAQPPRRGYILAQSVIAPQHQHRKGFGLHAQPLRIRHNRPRARPVRPLAQPQTSLRNQPPSPSSATKPFVNSSFSSSSAIAYGCAPPPRGQSPRAPFLAC